MPPLTWPVAFALALPAGWAAAYAAARLDEDAARIPPVATAAAAAVLFVWAAVVVPAAWLLAVSCLLAWALIVLAAVDVAAFRLPDAVTLPLVAVGLAVSWWLPDRDVAGHLAGAVAGYVVLAAIALAYRRLRGRHGLGLGDAKLLAAAGAWLGWRALPSVVLIACAGGFLWVLVSMLLKGRGAASARIPFGPPLCAGFWLVWLHGPLEPFAMDAGAYPG